MAEQVPRPDQAEVLRYRGGYMAVAAVPGAGKTWVLGRLAADLIAAGRHRPGQVLVVTYTNSAVGNFRARIAQFLAERGLPPGEGYDVRTLHSLALLIVRERPAALRLGENFAVAGAALQGRLLAEAVRRWIAAHRDLWAAALRPDLRPRARQEAEAQWEQATVTLLAGVIRDLKTRGLTPAEAAELSRRLPPESFLRWGAEVYGDYQALLAERGLVDYDDLVAGAWRLLRDDPELLARLRARWTYYLEDEAQDSSPVQARMLELLAGPDGNLVRVGDPNQAILATFTSADPRLFRRFCARPDVIRRELTYAGRSSPDIIDLANRLVVWSREEQEEAAAREALAPQFIRPLPPGGPLRNPQPARYQIRCVEFATSGEELGRLARWSAELVRRQPEKTVAVLLPTNELLENLAARLEPLGVPVELVRNGQHPRAAETVERLLMALEYLAAPWDGRRLGRLLGLLLEAPVAGPLEAHLRRTRLEEEFFPLEGAEPFAPILAAVPDRPEVAAALRRVRDWLQQVFLPPDSLVLYLARELGLEGEALATAQQMALILRRWLWEEPAAGLPEAVAHLREQADHLLRQAAGFFERQGLSIAPGRVYLTTYHSAKGLEWDVVMAGFLTRDFFPGSLSDRVRDELWYLRDDLLNPGALARAELEEVLDGTPDPAPFRRAKREIIEERLRLLYVAVTRARESLVLTCHRRRELAGGERPTAPAPAFLALRRHVEGRRAHG